MFVCPAQTGLPNPGTLRGGGGRVVPGWRRRRPQRNRRCRRKRRQRRRIRPRRECSTKQPPREGVDAGAERTTRADAGAGKDGDPHASPPRILRGATSHPEALVKKQTKVDDNACKRHVPVASPARCSFAPSVPANSVLNIASRERT